MPYGTVNADVISDSNGGSVAPISSVMRNRIINGAMTIDQRNAGASVSIPAATISFITDRFWVYSSQASKLTAQQNAGSVTPPVGFSNYLGTTSLSAYSVSATDLFGIVQRIEGFNTADLNWGTANAKTITLSFWVRSSLTGTFGGSLQNSSQDRSYPYTYTVSVANTWEQKTVTIAGDTSGTWLTTNGVGIQTNFTIGTGSTYSGTAGAWAGANYFSATGATSVVGTSGATFYITGVQLEKGTQATGFEYRQYGTELALCQRYFQQYGDNAANKNIMPYGSAAISTELDVYMTLPVVMRAVPTLSSLNLTGYDGANTPLALTGGTVYNATTSTFGAYWAISGATIYRPYMVRTYTNAGYMQLSAEL